YLSGCRRSLDSGQACIQRGAPNVRGLSEVAVGGHLNLESMTVFMPIHLWVSDVCRCCRPGASSTLSDRRISNREGRLVEADGTFVRRCECSFRMSRVRTSCGLSGVVGADWSCGRVHRGAGFIA